MSQDIYTLIEHLQGQTLDISYIMLAAARQVAGQTGGQVVALLLGRDARSLAEDLDADSVHHYAHQDLENFSSEAYLSILSKEIQAGQPRALLLGHTTIGMDVASGLSARLDLPLVSQVQQFKGMNFISQICGGKIMAEGTLPEPVALVTMVPGGYAAENGKGHPPSISEEQLPDLAGMGTRFLRYIHPEVSDVDISKEPILVSVGRGLQNQGDLEMVDRLAAKLHGLVCASRPLVDKGWLPASRLVGKSGKTVKPKLYLALGISGAPEHVEAIASSDLIIAVNTDPNAPLFDIATYGVEMDMMELLPVLIEKLEQGKVG